MSSDDEVEQPKVKRQTYKPKTLEEMGVFLETLKLSVDKMREAMFRNKKESNFPENAPSQNEFKALKREMDVLLRAYKHACQPKARAKKESDDSKKSNIGFNRREYILESMVDFINKHKIDSKQPDVAKVTNDGRGIFTRALLTSYWSNYIEAKELKHDTERKYIIPDEDMLKLFSQKKRDEAETAHKQKLKTSKKKKTASKKSEPLFVQLPVTVVNEEEEEEEGEALGFDFATLQMLLTLFVDKNMQVITEESPDEHLDELKEYFSEKTEAVRKAKKEAAEVEKERKKEERKKEKEKEKKKKAKKPLPKNTKANKPASKKTKKDEEEDSFKEK